MVASRGVCIQLCDSGTKPQQFDGFKKMIESHRLERPPSNGILEEDVMESPNEFSSSTYRVINFIVDVPVRIDRFINHTFDDAWVVLFL